MGPGWMTVALALLAAPAGSDAGFEVLARLQGGPVLIAPDAPDAPDAVDALPDVAAEPVLTIDTIRAVVARERASLWTCRPEPRDARQFVLDLAIRANGRVRDLRVRPASPSSLPPCALAASLRWRFPRFTGERADGRTVEIVNASVPVEFASPDE